MVLLKKKRKWERKKSKILRESSAMKNIVEMFIYPLMKSRPSDMKYRDWLNKLFCTNSRIIRRYYATRKFHIPGLYYAAANIVVPKQGQRFIREGSELWVRVDLNQPDRIDVETDTGVGKGSQVFRLTQYEWKSIRGFLKSEDDCE
jgi:hypothetical protein